jgi:serine/threonine protein kinase
VYQIELSITEGDGAGQRFEAQLPETGPGCVIGRAGDCAIQISDEMAADQHCRVFINGDRVMVENLDDEMGTCLNGDFVSDPMVLEDGSELLVGATVLRVGLRRVESGVSDEVAAPPALESVEATDVEEEPDGDGAVAELEETEVKVEKPQWPDRPNIPPAIEREVESCEEETPEVQGFASPPATEPISPVVSASQSDGGSSSAGESGTSRSWARKVTYGAEGELVDRIEVDLREEFPEQTAGRDADQFRAMIARGVERAHGYGLEEDAHVYQFMRCMVMLDDELDGRNPDTEDVWLTLNHARRTPAQRVDRAVKIATRLSSERSGSRSGFVTRPTPSPAKPSSQVVLDTPTIPASGSVSARASMAGLGDADVTAADISAGTHATRGTPPPADMVEGSEEMPDIEGFTLKEEIGAGGMGRVFLAHDHQLDKDVAIKVLRSVDPEGQEQLQHEARAAARLEHPNIVGVSRFEKHGRGGYYVMQFVRGMDGSQLIKAFEKAVAHQLDGEAVLRSAQVDLRRSPAELRELLSPEKNAYYRLVAHWIAGVADGLERAHAEGVLHRDIKPSNLLLSEDGRMMITDFGLAARPADRQGMGRARVGTPRYLSPERVADWASFSDDVQSGDARADIWALGGVVYEFLTYRPAYRGSIADVLRGIATEPPQAPTTLVWSVPEPMAAICLKAMARRPDDRFNRASDMAEALRGWIRVDLGIEKKGRIPFIT